MIKKLLWRENTHVSFTPKREPGEPTRLKERKLSESVTEFTPVEMPPQTADENERFTFLRVRNEHVGDLHPALIWFSGQSHLPMPKVVEKNGILTTVKIYGEFAPSLPEKEIHQMMLDYQLLSPYFESWSKVLAPSDRHTLALSQLLLGVAETVKEMKTALNDLGNEAVTNRLKALDPLPAWTVRFLEIRKALNR
ncbi:hypothetical protein N9174_04755 [bacterium]|nr:hypothetical protein [bacterium]